MNESQTNTPYNSGLGKLSDVLAMAERLMYFPPHNQRLSKTQALIMSQVSVAHGLDPWLGDIRWLDEAERGPDDQEYMIGISGKRRNAERTLGKSNKYWLDKTKISPADIGEPASSTVYRVVLTDSETESHWYGGLIRLGQAGITGDAALAILGQKPSFIGYGVWRIEESEATRKVRMSPDQLAMLRGEASVLDARFPMQFITDVTINDDKVSRLLDFGTELPPPLAPVHMENHRKSVAQNLADLGFGDGPKIATQQTFVSPRRPQDVITAVTPDTLSGTPASKERLSLLVEVLKVVFGPDGFSNKATALLSAFGVSDVSKGIDATLVESLLSWLLTANNDIPKVSADEARSIVEIQTAKEKQP